MTVSVADFATPSVAVIETDVFAPTTDVETMNVAVLLPAGTSTDAGSWATEVFPEVRLTVLPPAGAMPVSVIVPVLVPTPPLTVVGESLSDDMAGALIARLADF